MPSVLGQGAGHTLKPRFSNRAMISPTSPRWTPSGLKGCEGGQMEDGDGRRKTEEWKNDTKVDQKREYVE